MTEDELKKTWCPMVRSSVGSDPIEGNHAVNKWHTEKEVELGNVHLCIGSKCAMYREETTEKTDLPATAMQGRTVKRDVIRAWCGLAGKAF